MTEYRWKPAAHISIDAQRAGEELERIKLSHNGRLEQEYVVESAANPENPLHEHFDWNDQTAAHKFRLNQAQHLIMCIVSVPDGAEPNAEPIRAFVNVEIEKERFYVSTEDALSNPDLRAQVLNQAWRELEAWRQRHAELVEFAKVFAEIDKARLRP